jgi:hypothetical protein
MSTYNQEHNGLRWMGLEERVNHAGGGGFRRYAMSYRFGTDLFPRELSPQEKDVSLNAQSRQYHLEPPAPTT